MSNNYIVQFVCTIILYYPLPALSLSCTHLTGRRLGGALSAWLWRGRMSMGEVRGKTFVKLIEALVVKCRVAVHT